MEDSGIKTILAGEALTQYARVKLDASGQVVEADADDKGIGTVQAAVASGSPAPVRLWSKGTHKVVAGGAFSKNDILYGADEGLVDDVPGTGVAVGRALEAATASGDVVEMVPLLAEGNGLLYSNQADSAAVTNTASETAFDKSKTIAGGTLQVGDVIEVVLQGIATSTNANDTLNVKLKVGTEVVASTGAVDVADNDIFFIHAFVTVVALGASGTVMATGVRGIGADGTVTAKPFRTDQATEDISGSVAITATATWSAANAGNSCKLEILDVILHRQ